MNRAIAVMMKDYYPTDLIELLWTHHGFPTHMYVAWITRDNKPLV